MHSLHLHLQLFTVILHYPRRTSCSRSVPMSCTRVASRRTMAVTVHLAMATPYISHSNWRQFAPDAHCLQLQLGDMG